MDFQNVRPVFGKDCFIADDAKVIGNVLCGDDVSIWYGSVVRADLNEIKIGKNTNIQDLSVLHVDHQSPLFLGANVTIGHRAILHGCYIGDSCLIGMGAIIMNGAKIGANSLVAAGALVSQGKEYPPGSFIRGIPAKLIRELSSLEKEQYGNHFKEYVSLKSKYLKIQ